MKKYKIDINDIYGICQCGCVMIKNENDVYRPEQVTNYSEILHKFDKNFWCCNGCQNGYYKDGKEHSWVQNE